MTESILRVVSLCVLLFVFMRGTDTLHERFGATYWGWATAVFALFALIDYRQHDYIWTIINGVAALWTLKIYADERRKSHYRR